MTKCDLIYGNQGCLNIQKLINSNKNYTMKIFHVHGKEDLLLSRHQFFPTWSTDSVKSQSKFQQVILWFLKFIWSGKIAQRADTILKEKNKVGKLTLFNYKTYCKDTVIETVWVLMKKQINGTDLIAQKYVRINIINWISTKNAIKWCHNSPFKQWSWKKLDIHVQKNESRHRSFTLYQN